MYGFCRLGFSPAPSAGAACVANGLATATSRNEKNDATPAKHGHDPDDEVARPVAVQADRDRAEAGQDEQPEKQRALLPAPERRDRVRRRQRPARRPRDVREREVVAQERREEHDRRRRAVVDERRDQRVLRRVREPAAPRRAAASARDERVQGQTERDDERGATELGHGSRQAERLLRRVLRRALRDHRAGLGDERAVAELAVDDDVPADLEEVGDGARVPNGDGRLVPCLRCP